jgi:polysaccharide pyruvyl transferase WcaK-like protein
MVSEKDPCTNMYRHRRVVENSLVSCDTDSLAIYGVSATGETPSPCCTYEEPLMSLNRVALFGIFGVENLGNECTLQATLEGFRKHSPVVDIYCVCYGPENVAKQYGIPAVQVQSRRSIERKGISQQERGGKLAKLVRLLFLRVPVEIGDWLRAIRTLRGTRLVVMTGTGLLTDFSTSAFGYPYDILKWTTAARLAGAKIAFVGIGVGPIYERLSKFFIRRSLAISAYRSFRDLLSADRLRKFGCVIQNDPIVPDLAFSLPPHMFSGFQDGRNAKTTVGLGLMHFDDPHSQDVDHANAYREYLEKMCDFIQWLTSRGYGVRILEGDASVDRVVKREVKQKLESRGFRYQDYGIVDQETDSVEELIAQLAATDIVVSPRFHNLILGLMLNKPAISLSYDAKSNVLLDGVGLGHYCQSITSFDLDKLKEHVLQVDKLSSVIKPALRASMKTYRDELEEQYRTLCKRYLAEEVPNPSAAMAR